MIVRREEGLKSMFVISEIRELQLVNNGELCSNEHSKYVFEFFLG